MTTMLSHATARYTARIAGRFTLLAGLSLLSACGLANANVSTADQTFMVTSEPTGADCSLQRNGETLTSFATPQQVTVSKSRRDIAAVCTLPGYRETPATLESVSIDITPVHLLALGTAGVMAHSMAGNFNNYPDKTTVTLRPLAFADAAARDGFLAARKGELDSRAAAVERRIARSCTTPDFCRMERDNAEADQRTRLAKLEADIAAIPVQ